MLKKNNIYKIFGVFLLFFLISFTSANGLQVTQGNQTLTTLNINKTFAIDYTTSLNFSNQEAFNMFNIVSSNPSILSFDSFNLSSGETKLIPVTIKANSNFNGVINFQAYFNQNIGASNRTYIVNLNYPSGLDVCDLSIIAGDTIIFANNFTDSIALHNVDTNQDITTILSKQNYTDHFTSPVSFRYTGTYLTLPFTPICSIAVQDTNGLVHSNDYDFSSTLNVNINYPPTSINLTFLTTNYTLNYNSNVQDIFKITNTGNKTAKSIHLSGNWVTFNINDFDLNPGEQKNIGYTIQPQVFQTNDTNKNYTQIISATGNFPEVDQNISIFVPYSVITNQLNNGTFDPEFMRNLYNFYCSQKPEDSICANLYANGSRSGTNVTFTPEFVNALLQKYISLSSDYNSVSKNQLETTITLQNSTNETNEKIGNLTDQLDSTNNKVDDLTSLIIFCLILGGASLLTIIGFIIWNKSGKGFRNKLNFEKGELP